MDNILRITFLIIGLASFSGCNINVGYRTERLVPRVDTFYPSASAVSGASGWTPMGSVRYYQYPQVQPIRNQRTFSAPSDEFQLNTDRLFDSFPRSYENNQQRIHERRDSEIASNRALGIAHETIKDTNKDSGRLLSDSAFSKISETLGAINTVGHYLVDMVDDDDDDDEEDNVKDKKEEEDTKLPNALYTISKNVLGRNVTDTIVKVLPAPVKKVLPSNQADDRNDQGNRGCTTPEGKAGTCEDLSSCPQLLLNLGNLRESLCFKSLFVPGVCCPQLSSGLNEIPQKPTILTTSRPTFARPVTTTRRPTFAKPIFTTARPVVASSTYKPPVFTQQTIFNNFTSKLNYTNYVNQEDCGEPEWDSGRIVGGTEAASGAWPWMAAIFLSGATRTEFWCGGALLASRHILTAAHCTRDSRQRPFAARQFTVRLGDVDLERQDEPSRPITSKVAEVRAHPQFSRVGFYNDIAILILEEPVAKNKYVIPLCLPPPELVREQWAGRRATVVGWGTARYGGRESTTQRQAALPIWRNPDCDRAYFQPISEGFICAGYSEGGVDACQGDSGGPLMLQISGGKWVQIGVVSFGNKCGEPGYPGVYTRVSHFMDWIQSNLI